MQVFTLEIVGMKVDTEHWLHEPIYSIGGFAITNPSPGTPVPPIPPYPPYSLYPPYLPVPAVPPVSPHTPRILRRNRYDVISGAAQIATGPL